MRFHEFLVQAMACYEARQWVGKRGMKWAWEHCKYPGWMFWLLARGAGRNNCLGADFYSDRKSWANWQEVCGLKGELARRYQNIPRSLRWYSHAENYRNVYACNYIRKHFRLGKLSELTKQYEELTKQYEELTKWYEELTDGET